MSLVMRKPAFCICENKDADQLRGKLYQCLRIRYMDTIKLIVVIFHLHVHVLPNMKFPASSHLPWLYNSLVCVGPGRKTLKTGFS